MSKHESGLRPRAIYGEAVAIWGHTPFILEIKTCFIYKHALKSGNLRAVEMAHWVKHSPCKPDDLSSDPWHPDKS